MTSCELPQRVSGSLVKHAKPPEYIFIYLFLALLTDKQPQGLNHGDIQLGVGRSRGAISVQRCWGLFPWPGSPHLTCIQQDNLSPAPSEGCFNHLSLSGYEPMRKRVSTVG